MRFIKIPEGEFLMGVDDNSPEDSNETPRHSVWLDGYSIAEVPVTRGQWSHFLLATGYAWRPASNPELDIERLCPSLGHPVIYVSWFDCMEFCKWQSKEMKCIIRLPTEAEWERACRGTQGQPLPVSDETIYDWSAWVNANDDRLRPVGAHPKHKSPADCLDMWENVREWCLDWYDRDAYRSAEPRRNPKGPESGTFKVFRGGNPHCTGSPRCFFRGWDNPNRADHTTGFRVVMVRNQ
jgi:formylglycine-generating enzyme required for sulfatase activity